MIYDVTGCGGLGLTSASGDGCGADVGGAAAAVSLAANVRAPTMAPVYDSAPDVFVAELLALTTLMLDVLDVGTRFSAVEAEKKRIMYI